MGVCRCLKILLKQKYGGKKYSPKRLSKRAAFCSDKFEAYLAEKLLSLRFVVLFVMGKGIHECKTKRNNIYMPCNLSSFVHVTTATNTFCLEVAVKRESNHGFAPLNCDFEKNKAAVVMFYNVVQF